MKLLLLGFLLLFSACAGDHDHSGRNRGSPGHGGPAQAQATPVKPYPLSICLVGGDGLGKMGKPEVIVHEGREIKVCYDDCVAQFKKDPAKYLKVLVEAEKTLAASKNDHEEKK
jgi:hypothetical protein